MKKSACKIEIMPGWLITFFFRNETCLVDYKQYDPQNRFVQLVIIQNIIDTRLDCK